MCSAGVSQVCHCDLKLENLMLTHGPDQKRPHLKLIDFGLSKVRSDMVSRF